MQKSIVFMRQVILLLSILTISCEKEDYTLPVNVSMQFGIDETPVVNGLLKIESVAISLSSIDIVGYREIGEDVFFTRNFNEGKYLVTDQKNYSEMLYFDLPQGVYNPLIFNLRLLADEDEKDLLEDIAEWQEDLMNEDDMDELWEELGEIIEDYMEDVFPSLLIKGQYLRKSEVCQFLFLINDPIYLKVFAQNRNDGNEVLLSKNLDNKGRIIFNPEYWYSVVSPVILDAAYYGVIDDKKYLFINKYINTQIYTAIFNRIEESTFLLLND